MQTHRTRRLSSVTDALLLAALVAAVSVACGSAVDLQSSDGPTGGTASSAQAGTGGGPGSGGAGGQTGAGGQAGAGGGSGGCTNNTDCASDPKGNLCDTMTGECVGCLPSSDQCPSGQYCNPTTDQCEVGCTDGTDCNPSQVCDTQTNNCVGCTIDTDCPSGSICVSNTCVDGCSGMQPCQLGFSCCGSVCSDLSVDENNCGTCDNLCPLVANADRFCDQGLCVLGPCHTPYIDCNNDQTDGCEHNILQDGPCICVPGQTKSCYQGAPGTEGVGLCVGGTQTCNPDGLGWSLCVGQVLPAPDTCANGIDEDCDGTVDNGSDLDGDGWSECNGDCCDVVGPNCVSPATVNPGAFEFVGNMLDDDCDPSTSDTVPTPPCSTTAKFDMVTADDVARAIDLCQFTQPNPPMEQRKWGVIQAEYRLSNGNQPSMAQLDDMQNWQTAILQDYGLNVFPKVGPTMAAISSGKMRDESDPWFFPPNGGTDFNSASQPPPAYLAANGGMLPASAGCSGSCPAGSGANDSVNIRLTIRVPTNALSFSYKLKFNSAEYWTWSCTPYNDFFLALLQTTAPGIPADKNISFDSVGNPISVNNGFFEVCAPKGCYTCLAGTSELMGTGMEVSNTGGATKWLTTDAPVTPGEDMMLELMIFDVSDGVLDSLMLLDAFKWNPVPAQVGTHE